MTMVREQWGQLRAMVHHIEFFEDLDEAGVMITRAVSEFPEHEQANAEFYARAHLRQWAKRREILEELSGCIAPNVWDEETTLGAISAHLDHDMLEFIALTDEVIDVDGEEAQLSVEESGEIEVYGDYGYTSLDEVAWETQYFLEFDQEDIAAWSRSELDDLTVSGDIVWRVWRDEGDQLEHLVIYRAELYSPGGIDIHAVFTPSDPRITELPF